MIAIIVRDAPERPGHRGRGQRARKEAIQDAAVEEAIGRAKPSRLAERPGAVAQAAHQIRRIRGLQLVEQLFVAEMHAFHLDVRVGAHELVRQAIEQDVAVIPFFFPIGQQDRLGGGRA